MHISVTAIGADRPGIVAAVTKVLVDLNCNVEDSRMAILSGHFSMMLVVDPGSHDASSIQKALAPVAKELGLTLDVRDIGDIDSASAGGTPYVLTVYGADRPGIVHDVSKVLADHGINIIDLRTHVTSGDPPVYIMLMDVEIPGTLASAERELTTLASARGIDVSFRLSDAETL